MVGARVQVPRGLVYASKASNIAELIQRWFRETLYSNLPHTRSVFAKSTWVSSLKEDVLANVPKIKVSTLLKIK